MSEKSIKSTIQLGWLGVLTVVFAAAKLLGWINWSWWLVMLPGIVSVALVLPAIAVTFMSMLALLGGLCAVILGFILELRRK